jgi:hypothetical protein
MIGLAVKELQGSQTINISTTNTLILSPAYHNMRNVLLDALRKHPDARADVLAALQTIENDEQAAPAAPRRVHSWLPPFMSSGGAGRSNPT